MSLMLEDLLSYLEVYISLCVVLFTVGRTEAPKPEPKATGRALLPP